MADQKLDVGYWIGRWNKKDTPWHKTFINPMLEKHILLLDRGNKNLKILVPLCGKSIDMKWLADLGHRVVGVEISSLAVQSFFEDHSLEYVVEPKGDVLTYRDKSGQITIYCCDLFEFFKTGDDSFDAVWDRGSFGAVNSEDRPRYIELLSSLKKPNCQHLIELYEYDDSYYKGVPFNVPFSLVKELFGNEYNCELVETEEALEMAARIFENRTPLVRSLSLVTFKQKNYTWHQNESG